MLETSTPGATTYARHRLAWLDQLAYELFRVTGRSQLMQCVWLYDRDVNLAALARTNERLAALSFNRLIEPSPLPWGRPRWVKPAGTPILPEQSSDVLPRSRLLRWANQHARAPIDPVIGPARRMAIQSFDDGSTAVSIVGSHLLLDGMGALGVIEAAVNGTGVASPYLPKGARGRLSGCVSDAWQILADAPRTVAALARIAHANWYRSAAPIQRPAVTAAEAGHAPSTIVELPAVAVTVESRVWFACEQRLGGGLNTLLPGFVASLASHLGRRRFSDGAISLLVPINRRRGLDDERALAIEFHMMNVAPAGLATNLRPVNASRKALLRGATKNQTDVLASFLPAIAWMPRTAAKTLVNRLFNYAGELAASCSDLGMLPDGLAHIDGAPCRHVLARAVDVNVTRQDLERSHGHLVVVASRYDNTVSLCIEGCQLGPSPTTTDELRLAVSRTLADFGLDAIIDA
ncbi:hypothetical protein [Bradyrhizobium sp. McL0616]|uniref:hypothetical protein n=1 Tax=Bradyrhizobium sp. McL0616 TaxID=3415674 RepID=UPI003CF57E32